MAEDPTEDLGLSTTEIMSVTTIKPLFTQRVFWVSSVINVDSIHTVGDTETTLPAHAMTATRTAMIESPSILMASRGWPSLAHSRPCGTCGTSWCWRGSTCHHRNRDITSNWKALYRIMMVLVISSRLPRPSWSLNRQPQKNLYTRHYLHIIVLLY